MRAFLDRLGPGRAVRLDDNGQVARPRTFLRLLRAAVRDGQQMVAFADQDDVWLPEKLARGAAALAPSGEVKALYFARQRLVDAGTPLDRPARRRFADRLISRPR